jgi:regulator of sigma E protease
MYIIVAILIFGILIMIHELGHFSIARACGVHIDEFSIGMGPKLLQKKGKKQGTLYTIRALPIGGYVSMKGENEAEDAPDSFSSKKVWQRMAIVVAGAAMNLILGFMIVFVIVCMSRGQLASTTIHSFLDNSTSNAEGGLCEGDTVVKVGNVSVYTGEELTYEIMNQGNKPLSIVVLRDGERVTLENVTFPTFEESGSTFGDYDFKVYAVKDPTLGQLLHISLRRSLSLVKMVWDSVINLVSGRYALTSLSSPVGVTSAVKDTIQSSNWNARQILQYVLHITAVISINLGVFNLLPFPALDGGRFVLLAFEGITRKKVPQEIEGKINFAGIVLLMILMVVVVGKDIVMLILK